ncbi:hypothetical protein Efla_003578 [Eimeria flavescens]
MSPPCQGASSRSRSNSSFCRSSCSSRRGLAGASLLMLLAEGSCLSQGASLEEEGLSDFQEFDTETAAAAATAGDRTMPSFWAPDQSSSSFAASSALLLPNWAGPVELHAAAAAVAATSACGAATAESTVRTIIGGPSRAWGGPPRAAAAFAALLLVLVAGCAAHRRTAAAAKAEEGAAAATAAGAAAPADAPPSAPPQEPQPLAAAAAAADTVAKMSAVAADAAELAELLGSPAAAAAASRLEALLAAARGQQHILQLLQQQEQQQQRLSCLERLKRLHAEAVADVYMLSEATHEFLSFTLSQGVAQQRSFQRANKELQLLYKEAAACLANSSSNNPLQVYNLGAQLAAKSTTVDVSSLHAAAAAFEDRRKEHEKAGKAAAAAAAAAAGDAAGDAAAAATAAEAAAAAATGALLREAIDAVKTSEAAFRRIKQKVEEGLGWVDEAADAAVVAAKAAVLGLETKVADYRRQAQLSRFFLESTGAPEVEVGALQRYMLAATKVDDFGLQMEQLQRRLHAAVDPFVALQDLRRAQVLAKMASQELVAAPYIPTAEAAADPRAGAAHSPSEESDSAAEKTKTPPLSPSAAAAKEREQTERLRSLLLRVVEGMVADAEAAEMGDVDEVALQQIEAFAAPQLPVRKSEQLVVRWQATVSAAKTTLTAMRQRLQQLHAAPARDTVGRAAEDVLALASFQAFQAAAAVNYSSAAKAWFRVEKGLAAAFEERGRSLKALHAKDQKHQQWPQQQQQRQGQEEWLQQEEEQLLRNELLRQHLKPQEEVLQQQQQTQPEVYDEQALHARAVDAFERADINAAALLTSDILRLTNSMDALAARRGSRDGGDTCCRADSENLL